MTHRSTSTETESSRNLSEQVNYLRPFFPDFCENFECQNCKISAAFHTDTKPCWHEAPKFVNHPKMLKFDYFLNLSLKNLRKTFKFFKYRYKFRNISLLYAMTSNKKEKVSEIILGRRSLFHFCSNYYF